MYYSCSFILVNGYECVLSSNTFYFINKNLSDMLQHSYKRKRMLQGFGNILNREKE